jgi:hypothetical protein
MIPVETFGNFIEGGSDSFHASDFAGLLNRVTSAKIGVFAHELSTFN